MVTAGKGAHIACRVGSCAALQLGQRQLCLSATHTVLPHMQHQPPLQTAPSLAVASHGSLGAAWNFSDKKTDTKKHQISGLLLVSAPRHSVVLPGGGRFKMVLAVSLTCGKANGRLAGSLSDCSILFASLAAAHRNRPGSVAALHTVRSTPSTSLRECSSLLSIRSYWPRDQSSWRKA